MARRISGCYIPPDRADHMARHGVIPEEVHEVLENEEFPPVWQRTRALGKSPAYVVYGRTSAGRYLLIPGIVFSEAPLKDVFMPATARDMTRPEQNYYEGRAGR